MHMNSKIKTRRPNRDSEPRKASRRQRRKASTVARKYARHVAHGIRNRSN